MDILKVKENGICDFVSSALDKPKTFRQLRRFVGMINFYHRFLKNGAEILAPLNELLAGYKKTTKYREIAWTDRTMAAFDMAKNAAHASEEVDMEVPPLH